MENNLQFEILKYKNFQESELHSLVSLKRKIFSQEIFEKWLNFKYLVSDMKGAYIIGENWNFVILEKLGKDKYFVSRTFNCTNIEDLKGIYKNLMFVKSEIIEMIKKENKND